MVLKMSKIKHCFGKFEIELTLHDVKVSKNKKTLCCTIQNPFVSYKHEKTFLDDTEERIIRKIDRQIKVWRKEFFKEN